MRKIIHNNNELKLKLATYFKGDRICIKLLDKKDGMHYMTATVNMPEVDLKHDEVLIKDYSENEGILEALIRAEVISDPIDVVSAGFVEVFKCKLLINAEDI